MPLICIAPDIVEVGYFRMIVVNAIAFRGKIISKDSPNFGCILRILNVFAFIML